MASANSRRPPATIVVPVFANGFAGYAVAPRVEGDTRRRELDLAGTTLPLYCTYEIAGEYVPQIPEKQMRIQDLEEAIESLQQRGFKVTKTLAED